MSAAHTPGPMIVGRRQRARLLQYVWVPAKFWDDHSDRCPSDDGRVCDVQERKGNRVLVYGDFGQMETLRSDAEFYAEGNVDDCPALVASARRTLAALKETA